MNWRKLIFENYGAKLALLFMAVFLWFFVVTSREYHHVLQVPIRIENGKEDKVFVEEPISHAEVNFRGKGTSLLLLSLFGDVHLELDIGSINYFFDYPIRIDQVKWASGINIDVVEILGPDTVFIRIDDRIERTLKIRSTLNVNPAEGYVLMGDLKVEPDSVVISGAKSILGELDYIPTQAKTIDNATSSVSTKLNLIPPDGIDIVLEPQEVRAYWTVEKIETRLVTAVPIQIIQFPPDENSFCEPRSVDLWLRAPKSLLDTLRRSNILATISPEGIPGNAGIFSPVISLPQGIDVVQVIPDSVQVNYKRADL